jgi:flavin-dependent dehydrogenase
MLLARKGYKVLLVDKAHFPSDTMSTHYIHQPGIARLNRWGLLRQIQESNCPPINRYTIDFGSFTIAGSPPPADGIVSGYCPRRTVLDKILIDAARGAGAEVREGFGVKELVKDGNTVTGIRGSTRNNSPIVEKARMVIGADGLGSMVARSVGAPEYYSKPSLECAYYTYWSGLPLEGFEIYRRDHRMIFASRTNDGLACIGVVWTHREFHEYRSNIERNYLMTLDIAPGFAERVRNARREAPFVGTAHVPNYFRKPYGDGWALVGDAGYHKDPTTAGGITDAFRDAELLVEAIDAGFTGRRGLHAALAVYERHRNKAALPTYEFYTTHVARLDPIRPELKQLLLSLRDNQREVDRFCGAMVGTVPIQEFFSLPNMLRTMGPRRFIRGMYERLLRRPAAAGDGVMQ